MADGKVMQKYYPPDFDPEALKKNRDVMWALRKAKSGKRRRGPRMMEMRMMFPFTLQCDNCRDFVYVGTKFNAKVEKIRDEDYLGIPIWRFYGRCPHCRHQLVMKTDPKNVDYVMVSGGTRTSDPNRDASLAEAALREAQQEAAEGDAVKALEIKSYSTAEELKAIEQLDELRRINKRFMSLPDKLTEVVLKKVEEVEAEKEEELDAEEMDWARKQFQKRDFGSSSSSDGGEGHSLESHGADEDPRVAKQRRGSAAASSRQRLEEVAVGRDNAKDSDDEDSDEGFSSSSGEESDQRDIKLPPRRKAATVSANKTSRGATMAKSSIAPALTEAADKDGTKEEYKGKRTGSSPWRDSRQAKTLSNSHARMFSSSVTDLGVEVRRVPPHGSIDKTDQELDELVMTLAEKSIEDYAPQTKRRH